MVDIKQYAGPNSDEFKEGVEAGLNSVDDIKTRQPGKELGRELNHEGEKKEPVDERPSEEDPSTPPFISDSPEGHKGNAQDEKDETPE